jgi:acylphosphatase
MVAIRVHMLISGRVRGVFYRSSTRRTALELGLTGWVRNLPDGRVEIVVEGEEDQVEELIDWCRKGPPSADVKGLEVKQERPTGEFKRFSVKF